MVRQFSRLLIALNLLFLGFFSNAQNSIEGDWYGVINVMGTEMRLSYTFTISGDTLKATMGSLDQGVFGIPMEKVELLKDKLIITQSSMLLKYKGVVNEDFTQIKGIYAQSGQEFKLNLGRKKIEKKVLVRPQELNPPFPYYSEDVSFVNKKESLTLSGTLTLPSKEGKYPVVVLISGSGAQDRNEELLGHKPFLVLSDFLTRKGIGVLRYDDRGTAKSTGSHSTATTADFATDVEAAIDYLKKRKDIDKKKIGLIGHSEGGLIAPMVAVNRKDVSFIVMLAGPGIPGDEILIEQGKLIALAEGKDSATVIKDANVAKQMYTIINNDTQEEAKVKLTEFIRNEIDGLSEEEKKSIPDVEGIINSKVNTLNNVWFRYFLSYDPRPTLQKLRVPLLAINGEKDLQVPFEANLEAIKEAVPSNEFNLIKAIPKLNHLFQTSDTGAVSEYGELEETFSPIALGIISDWLLSIIEEL